MLNIQIRTENAAFEDNFDFELANVMHQLIKRSEELQDGNTISLRDTNGNSIGFASLE